MGGPEQLQGGEDEQGGWAGRRRGRVHPTRHLVSFPSLTGRRAPCTPPCFLWLSPPEVPPSCDIDEAACISHAVLFCLFFRRQGSVHLARRLVFFLSFCPEDLLLGDLRGSVHPTHCLFIFLFFNDGGGTRPHSGSFPPLLGGFFFFCGCIVNGGGV